MIYSVKFLQIIPMTMKLNFDHKKVFLFINFHYHLILSSQYNKLWDKFYKENEMIKVGQP